MQLDRGRSAVRGVRESGEVQAREVSGSVDASTLPEGRNAYHVRAGATRCCALRPPLIRESQAQVSARLLTLAGEIRVRLTPICAEMPTALFDEMVLRMAYVQLRFENAPLLA